MQKALHQFTVRIPQVHAAAATVLPEFAGGAFILFHPTAVAIRNKAVFPYLHEVVLVDVPLGVVGPDAGACRNGAVGQYGAYGYAGIAHIEMIADVAFVVAHKAFAGK